MNEKSFFLCTLLLVCISLSAQKWVPKSDKLYPYPTDTKVGIGTTNPQYLLDVKGTIFAYEILVNTTGADFVFQKDYHLLPLEDVAAYIEQNKHLPEIPTAAQMQAEGVSLDKLTIQLLQKVEELTLYIIEQDKRIKELEQQNQK